jgi:hypothetical protein
MQKFPTPGISSVGRIFDQMEGQPFLRTHACGICRTRHKSQSVKNFMGQLHEN